MARLRDEPPLLLRIQPREDGGPCRVLMVGGAAGPLGGDQVELTVEVGPGAALELASVAATLALPGPTRSIQRFDVVVGSGGWIDFRPEPVIAVRGCDHLVDARVQLGSEAGLVWREEIIAGRSSEPSGALSSRLWVDLHGVPLLRSELSLTGPGAAGAARLAGARAVGQLLAAGTAMFDRLEPAGAGTRAATLDLAAGGRLRTVLAPDAAALRTALTGLVGRAALDCSP